MGPAGLDPASGGELADDELDHERVVDEGAAAHDFFGFETCGEMGSVGCFAGWIWARRGRVTYGGSLPDILSQKVPGGEGGELRVFLEKSARLRAFPGPRGADEDDAGCGTELCESGRHRSGVVVGGLETEVVECNEVVVDL